MRQNMDKITPTDKVTMLTEKEAAQYIGMSRSFLNQDRMNGYRETRTQGPRYIKLGRSVRYHIEDLDSWLIKNRVDRIG
jgi:predicted DNA-binding transcriptional regulator AlpA